MRGDPAVVSAAVALLAGVANPIRDYLALSPDDQLVMAAVITESLHIRDERDKAHLDYLARATAGQTTAGFASVMQSFRKSLSRMFRGR